MQKTLDVHSEVINIETTRACLVVVVVIVVIAIVKVLNVTISHVTS